MPTRLSPPNADELRSKMEQSIDRLADLARSNITLGDFVKEILKSALDPGAVIRALLWHSLPEGRWQLVGGIPSPIGHDACFSDVRQGLLSEVSVENRPRVLKMPLARGDPLGRGDEEANGSNGDCLCLFLAIRHEDVTVGILETLHEMTSTGQLPAERVHFLAMLCEVTADFLAQRELQQLRQARVVWQSWDQFLQRLWQSSELSSVCATIANDGRLLAESDRISVAIRDGNSFRLQSVSGVADIDPRSSATRSLESLAMLAGRTGESIWLDHSHPTVEHDDDHDRDLTSRDLLESHCHDSGATGIGIVPIGRTIENKTRSAPIAVIVFERFKSTGDFSSWRSLGESVALRSASVLRAAIERDSIPRFLFWLNPQRWTQLVFGRVKICVMLLLAGMVAALILIPAEFTVSGSAELWPAQRREVFAGTSGVVDEILVTHGQEVSEGQPLIVLLDPELEIDGSRVIGEIATVIERLKGVQAARFTGSNTADAGSRSRQLTAEEEELKERLRTLERQRSLVDARITSLTLRSPIAGRVLTWDVSQHLSARPVERGQSLLTVGKTSGPWVVEVRVPDKDVGHILRARKVLRPDLEVEFMLASEPGKTYRGKIQDVSLSSEVDESFRNHVRVVVAFDREQIEQPRPGATVLPRIRCGRMSLGYVWLHDLIDAGRTRILF